MLIEDFDCPTDIIDLIVAGSLFTLSHVFK
jgi:hypothetical protein